MKAKPELSGSDIALDVVFTPQEYKKTISSLVGTASVHDGALYCDDSGDYAILYETPVDLYFKVVFNPDSVSLCYVWETTGTARSLTITNGVATMTGFTLYVNGVAGGTVVAGQDNTIVGVPSAAYTYTAIWLGQKLDGSMSQFTIYRSTKTAGEASNDYENKTHRELQTNSEFLRVDARNGWIENSYVDDQVGTDLLSGFDFTDGWTGVTTSEVTTSGFTTSNSGGVYKSLVTAGKKYKVHIKGTTTGGTFGAANWTVTSGSSSTTDTNFTLDFIGTKTLNGNLYITINGAETVTITTFTVVEIVPPVTNTAVTLVRDGSYAMSYNGTTSSLNCGNYNDLTGDITAWALIKPRSTGGVDAGRIFSNGKFEIIISGSALAGTNVYGIRSNGGGTWAETADNIITLNSPQLVCITRTSAGVTNIYIDGKLSGSANQDSGTPVAGTTNLFMGNRDAGDRGFDGLIMASGIEQTIWTAAQCIQAWTALKGFVQ